MKAIWTQDEASYHGEFVNFDRIWSWPKPAQRPHPPVLVGGLGPTVLDRVLAFGDAWFPNYGPRRPARARRGAACSRRPSDRRDGDGRARGGGGARASSTDAGFARVGALDPVRRPGGGRARAGALGVGDRRGDRRGVTAAEARERFAAARVARLATADARGRPHLVPRRVRRRRRSHLQRRRCQAQADHRAAAAAPTWRENPAVALLVDHYDDADWDALWWVRADGQGRVLELDDPEARRAVELLRARYPQQRVVGAVLAVDVERWSGWSGSDDSRRARSRARRPPARGGAWPRYSGGSAPCSASAASSAAQRGAVVAPVRVAIGEHQRQRHGVSELVVRDVGPGDGAAVGHRLGRKRRAGARSPGMAPGTAPRSWPVATTAPGRRPASAPCRSWLRARWSSIATEAGATAAVARHAGRPAHPAVISSPRRTGRNGRGVIGAPARCAMCSATASAC